MLRPTDSTGSGLPGFGDRQLHHYPSTAARAGQLAIVVAVSVVIFYEIYVQGAVSGEIIADFGIPLRTFVLASILGNLVGAVAAWSTGIADAWGRANLIIAGAGLAGVICLFGLPQATSAPVYIGLYTILSLCGGVVLVATQALVRDFSPQLGRATAMGVWTLGPVLGNLVISVVTSRTVTAHPEWQFHYRVAGAAGLVTFTIALVWLRELSPALRNQVMVSLADREAVERRAAEAPVTSGAAAPSMWTPTLVVPAAGITLFLMFYVTRVGFFVLYFVTTFAYTTSRANGLATWYWVANAIALVATGLLSDRLRVRKPFMVVGAIISIGSLVVFATRATEPDTSYAQFVVLLVLLAVGGAMVNNAWLTLFSETVERLNPAAVARGMAVYGSVLRAGVTVTLVGFILTVSAAGTLVDRGPEVARISGTYAAELATLGTVPPAAIATLRTDPQDPAARASALGALSAAPDAEAALSAALAVPVADLTYLSEHGAQVQQAVKDSPLEWRRWWWICVAAQIAFLPLGLRLSSRSRQGEDADAIRG